MHNRNEYYQRTDERTTDNYRMNAGYKYDYKKIYTEGNVVRKYENVPEYDDDCSEAQKIIRERRAKEKREQDRADRMRRRKLEESKGIGLSTCIVLASIVVLLLYLCIDYVNMRADITSMSKVVASKKAEYNSLKAKNDSMLKEVQASIDYEEIYNLATKELGMVVAEDNQLIRYKSGESAYVRQYNNLPEHKKDEVIEDILSAIN